MRRETQNVTLVLVGGVLIKIVLDGTYLRYVAPWSGSVVFAGGVAIVALGAAAIVRDLRCTGRTVPPGSGGDRHDPDVLHGSGGERHDPDVLHGSGDDRHDPGGHGDSAGSRPAWLMLLPVLAVLLIAPPALGSGALVEGRTRPVADPADVSAPLPPGDAPALALVDFVSRAAADPHGPLAAREVTLTGFLAPGAAPDRPDLARWVISCCAADASAVRVHLAAPAGRIPHVAPDGPDRWVQFRGHLVSGTGTAPDGYVPTLAVTESLSVAAPDAVYEY